MKHRSVIAVVCFSIITLNIYDLFWLASTKKELNARTKEHVPSIWLLFTPLLLLIPFIIVLGIIAAANRNSNASGSVGGASVITVIIVTLIAMVAVVIVPVYWNLKYARAVNEYTNGELSTAVVFLLLWVLRFVGMAVIQDKFNDMIAMGNTGGLAPINGMPAQMSTNPSVASVSPVADGVQTPGYQQPFSPPAQQPIAPVVQSTPQQPPVDPTIPQSYAQPTQPQPPDQPTSPPSGPLVQ
jgi:hypothetical protein